MIISISGAHGSGKSTLAKQLAGKLNWPHYYMGGLRREAAKKEDYLSENIINWGKMTLKQIWKLMNINIF